MGIAPFAIQFRRKESLSEVVRLFSMDENAVIQVSVAGRIMAIRRMGKASFAHIQDQSGRVQIYVKQDRVGEKTYELFKLLDIGDIIGVQGTVFRTHLGEITVLSESVTLLAKSLRPLPIVKEKIEDNEKHIFDAFREKEQRYRQRYVDLIVNRDVMDVFILRSRAVAAMRDFLGKKGYLEVETPVLQPLYGGAFARPFETHHHALDMNLYLRIADELYLKRLMVGGFNGVFEISKDFRNEGMDKDHNPEFTMMELYVAYEEYHFMMDLVEEMLRFITKAVHSTDQFTFQGKTIDLGKPWRRIGYFDAIAEKTGFDLFGKPLEVLREATRKLKIEIEPDAQPGKILDTIFAEAVEPDLSEPTFVLDYPLELSPLARKHRSKEGLVERFEGFIAGKEICNAFSELNDPVDQRERLEEQARHRAMGDEEAMVIDDDYLRAMEYGMPPVAGLGVGVDRLVMLLSNSASIRDVILFPQMKSEKG